MLWSVSFSRAFTFHALNFSFHYLSLFSCHVSVLIRWLPCDKSSCCVSDTNAALKVVQFAIKAAPFLRNFLKLQWDKAYRRNFDMHSRLSPPAVPAVECSAKSVSFCSWFAEIWSAFALAREKWHLTLIFLNICKICKQKKIYISYYCPAFAWVGTNPNRARKVQLVQSLAAVTMCNSSPQKYITKKTSRFVVAFWSLRLIPDAFRGGGEKSRYQ